MNYDLALDVISFILVTGIFAWFFLWAFNSSEEDKKRRARIREYENNVKLRQHQAVVHSKEARGGEANC